MLISVIIPVYNVEKYILKCLDSVTTQDYEDLEIICVEDCSTDNSLSLLQEYASRDKRIKLIHNDKNLGLGFTRNEGVKIATGDYIHFLDSDDWIEQNSYSRLVKKIENLKVLPDILVFDFCFFDNINNLTFKRKEKENVVYDRIQNPQVDLSAFKGWDRYAWMKLHKRSFLIENNIWYNDNPCMEDVEQAALVYTKATSICYVNECVVNYRTRRIGSLINSISFNINYLIKSYDKNRYLYNILPSSIRYTLLGFDYYLVRQQVIEAFLNGFLSFKDFVFFLYKYNTFEVMKYITDKEFYYGKSLYINILKVMINKYFPNLYKKILQFKRKCTIS